MTIGNCFARSAAARVPGSRLRRVESAAHLAAALARASSPADPYRWQTVGCDSREWRTFADLIADEELMDAWVRGCGQAEGRCCNEGRTSS